MILISIITINYNNCHGLLNTLNSINNQSYKNFELIVIDGKSKDDSITIIKDFYYIQQSVRKNLFQDQAVLQLKFLNLKKKTKVLM